jgi:hypothetical protein
MASFSDDLDIRIAKEFTKHGWKQVSQGLISFYERPLSMSAYERMVRPKKATISRRNKGIQAVKRFFDRLFLHKA